MTCRICAWAVDYKFKNHYTRSYMEKELDQNIRSVTPVNDVTQYRVRLLIYIYTCTD